MKQPLLTLAMIVKDEADSIEATIKSVAGVVDLVVLVDTGSKDGTPEIATQACRDVGLELDGYFEKFVDFSTTRNLAIEIAEESGSQFVLMLSGNETLQGDVQALRQFCENPPAGGAFHLECKMGEMSYATTRLSRTGAGWRYKGVTHEVMVGPGGGAASITVPGVYIFHDISRRTVEQASKGWTRDVELLSKELERDPGNTRATFYLAQSYEMLKQYEKAIDTYVRRVELGGWGQEVYISLLRIARNMKNAGRPWPEVQQQLLLAYNYNPKRAEPLFDIGQHYYDEGKHNLAYVFFLAASEIPYPKDEVLFVEPRAYELVDDRLAVSAWYAGKHEQGEEAARRALAKKPGDARLLQNLSYYESRKRPPGGKLTEDLDLADLRKRLGDTKVIVSVTTIPSRWDLLKKAVDSLVAQRFKPDHIYVVVPRTSKREGTPYNVPVWLKGHPRVEILDIETDFGPASKLLGPLSLNLDPDTIIVTFDDDSEYEEHVLEKLVDRAIRYPGAAIGFSGINVERLIKTGEYELVYEQFGRRPQDPTPANVIEGYCGVAYRAGFFDAGVVGTLGYPEDVFFVDDFWFSGYLAKKGIPKLVFHYSDLTLTREEVWYTIWKQNGLNTDSNPLHLISDFKEKNRRVAIAFAEKFPGIWLKELDLSNVEKARTKYTPK